MQIKDETIRNYIAEHCIIEEDCSVVSKDNKVYLEHTAYLNTPYNLIIFLVKHHIYQVCSYNNMRKSIKSRVACCGFSESEQKWYGWTHRGVRCFGIGDSYLGSKPAKTLEDCKKLAFYAVQALM